MAHIIPFRLPETAKAPRREAPANSDQTAKITYLGALKRQAPIRAGE